MRFINCFIIAVSCLCLFSCGSSDEFVLVNGTKYTITCTGWIAHGISSTEIIEIAPGQRMTLKTPQYEAVRYNVCTEAGISYFDDIPLGKVGELTLRIDGNYPQLEVKNPGKGPAVVVGSLSPNPGFELTWEGEPPADKQPNAEGLFSFSQFPRGMSIEELDWILAGRCEQQYGGPRHLPLLFGNLEWKGVIYEQILISPDNTSSSYRGEIVLGSEASAERLEGALSELYVQKYRPMYFRHITEADLSETVFYNAENRSGSAKDHQNTLNKIFKTALDSGSGRMICVLVKEDVFDQMEGAISENDVQCWVIKIDFPESSLRLIDTITRHWRGTNNPL